MPDTKLTDALDALFLEYGADTVIGTAIDMTATAEDQAEADELLDSLFATTH